MAKLYYVYLIGSKEGTLCTQEDVAKLVRSANSGAKLVLVGGSFINPASIARIDRAWNANERDIERTDPELLDTIRADDDFDPIKRLN